jgi:hypothetical protein
MNYREIIKNYVNNKTEFDNIVDSFVFHYREEMKMYIQYIYWPKSIPSQVENLVNKLSLADANDRELIFDDCGEGNCISIPPDWFFIKEYREERIRLKKQEVDDFIAKKEREKKEEDERARQREYEHYLELKKKYEQ